MMIFIVGKNYEKLRPSETKILFPTSQPIISNSLKMVKGPKPMNFISNIALFQKEKIVAKDGKVSTKLEISI